MRLELRPAIDILAALTPTGFELIDNMLVANVANLQRLLDTLSDEEKQQLHRLPASC